MWLRRCECCNRLVERVYLETEPFFCSACEKPTEPVCPVCNDRAPWCPDQRKETK